MSAESVPAGLPEDAIAALAAANGGVSQAQATGHALARQGFAAEDARIAQDLTNFVTANLGAIQVRQHESGRAPAK